MRFPKSGFVAPIGRSPSSSTVLPPPGRDRPNLSRSAISSSQSNLAISWSRRFGGLVPTVGAWHAGAAGPTVCFTDDYAERGQGGRRAFFPNRGRSVPDASPAEASGRRRLSGRCCTPWWGQCQGVQGVTSHTGCARRAFHRCGSGGSSGGSRPDATSRIKRVLPADIGISDCWSGP